MIQTLSDALSERGYETLTPVQVAVTDPDLRGADLLVSAQTGSGKTVGFGLAIGPTLLDEAGRLGVAEAPLALIVAPTRELAFQVKRELDWLYDKAGARVASCVGGMDMRDERRALARGAHIVVGTPGRLRDHIQRGSLDLTSIRAVVLDEADEMLDLGFREDLEFMLGEAPEDRRTLMFSATVPRSIERLAQTYQRDAVRVATVAERSQHADITYQAVQVAPQDAENAIINVLRYHEAQNAIVFANTRAAVNRLTSRFGNRGFAVVSLSGELSQTERTHALQAMRDGRARVCVATDVAARGIDLPNLELVIHAELPTNVESLLHRSGRTGRAGRKGISALIVPPKARSKAERLLKMGKITAEWGPAPGADEILRRDEERLLAHEAFTGDLTEEEAAFADRLIETHSPLAIAAACLRLTRAQHSAPEELSAPDARPEPRERAPFGPSQWVSLTVGRNERAEPRWLLPLLCRVGGLNKNDIGAIRVQQDETFVELAEKAVAPFLTALGPEAALEDGVTVRKLDAAPDLSRPVPRPDRPDRPKLHRGAPDGGEAPAKRKVRRTEHPTPPPTPEPPPVQAPVSAPAPQPPTKKPKRKPDVGARPDRPPGKPKKGQWAGDPSSKNAAKKSKPKHKPGEGGKPGAPHKRRSGPKGGKPGPGGMEPPRRKR